jgi:hypothetical protein
MAVVEYPRPGDEFRFDAMTVSMIELIAGTFYVWADVVRKATILRVNAKTDGDAAGTLTVKINGTNITGLTNLSVTTVATNFLATANNELNIGDSVTFDISNVTGTGTARFVIHYQNYDF